MAKKTSKPKLTKGDWVWVGQYKEIAQRHQGHLLIFHHEEGAFFYCYCQRDSCRIHAGLKPQESLTYWQYAVPVKKAKAKHGKE